MKSFILIILLSSMMAFPAELNITIPNAKMNLLFNSLVSQNQKTYTTWRAANPLVNKYIFIKYITINHFKKVVMKYQKNLAIIDINKDAEIAN